jgi:hypothetical protein
MNVLRNMWISQYNRKKGKKYMTIFNICAVHQLSSYTVSFVRNRPVRRNNRMHKNNIRTHLKETCVTVWTGLNCFIILPIGRYFCIEKWTSAFHGAVSWARTSIVTSPRRAVMHEVSGKSTTFESQKSYVLWWFSSGIVQFLFPNPWIGLSAWSHLGPSKSIPFHYYHKSCHHTHSFNSADEKCC